MINEAGSRDSKKGDQYARFYEYCLKKSKEPQPDMSFRESFITTYQWKIDDLRFGQLLKLSEESRRKFFEKFENMYGIYRTNLSGVFDHLMRFINQKTGNPLDC